MRAELGATEKEAWAGYFTMIGRLLKPLGHRAESIYRRSAGGIYTVDSGFAARIVKITDRIDREWEAR